MYYYWVLITLYLIVIPLMDYSFICTDNISYSYLIALPGYLESLIVNRSDIHR